MTYKVRLSNQEIEAIKKVVLDLDQEAMIYLFGSRVNLAARGGDIDLLILSQTLTSDHALDIRYALFQKIEEQKIDLVIAKDDHDPFVKIALASGIKL